MKFSNLSDLGKRKNQKKQSLKILICLTLTFIFLLNYLFITSPNHELTSSNDISNDSIIDDLQTNTPISILQDPFTKNFDDLRNFFEHSYRSNLGFSVPLYYRYGDTNGDIIDGTIFSEDNLLYYKSLMQMELNDVETYQTYLDLKDTTLWYEGNVNEYKYGFVKSIDNITGAIKNDDRYLIDNLMPIFLLIENIGDDINSFTLRGTTPRQSINEMFYLINSSQFWDARLTYNGFYQYNSSNTKYSESNFYAILANLLIHRTYVNLGLAPTIRDRAFELANLTMIDMVDKGYMWDSSDKAFYHDANQNWDTSIAGQKYYHLST
ncbi:MAG: hypothetical protein ACFFAV_06845, partial [Candidatus Hermodarchaeota archaeon]